MLRAVLLGVLAVTSVVGCKSEAKSSAQVQPGVAAGKVLEVKGTVTVKHGDASKPLAVGDSVEADDVVTTGADSNVVIELAHNSVRWELGANKTQKVKDSIAFKAEKNTGPTATVDQDTAAAGRPAERSAVETSATAVEKADEAPPAAEPAMAAPPAPPAAEEAAPAPAPAPERKRSRPSRTTRSAAKKEAAPEIPSADAAMSAPREETAAAPTTRGGTRGPQVIARKIEVPMAPPSAAATATAESAKAAPPPGGGGGGASNQALVTMKLPALRACMAGHKEVVNVAISISGGVPTVKITSKAAVSAALQSCMTNVIKSIKLAGDGKASATVKP